MHNIFSYLYHYKEIHLKYLTNRRSNHQNGIEPLHLDYEPNMLPLHHWS